jgi:hypothetical protein
MLLFAFLSAQSAFMALPKDTIIVDGELVEIEPRRKRVNIDSLDQAAKQDVSVPREKIHFSLSALSGLDVSRCRWSGENDSMVNLNQFLGEKAYWKPTFSGGIETCVLLNSQLGINTGLGWSQLKYGYETINTSTLSSSEARFAFESRNGELYEYVKYEVGPGFETDTLLVSKRDYIGTMSFLEVPIGLRIYPVNFQNKFAFYIDLGGLFRRRVASSEFAPAYLLNAQGDLSEVNMRIPDLPKNYFTANIRFGCQGTINQKWRWQAQATVVNFPETDLNTSDFFRVRFSTWRIQAGICRFFSW